MTSGGITLVGMSIPRAVDAANKARLSPHAAFLVVVAVLLTLVSAATYGAHEIYEGVAAGNGIETFDMPTLDAVLALRRPWLTDVAVGLTYLAGRAGTPLLGVLALALFTWRRRDWAPTVLLVTGLLGSLTITVVGKRISDRARPPRQFALPPFETSPSFPSGHTLNATVLAVLVGYLVFITVRPWLARWVAVGVCALDPVCVAASRVYLGQHWLTDVMAGLLIGTAWACAVILARRLWVQMRRYRAHRGVPLESPAPPPGDAHHGGATAAS